MPMSSSSRWISLECRRASGICPSSRRSLIVTWPVIPLPLTCTNTTMFGSFLSLRRSTTKHLSLSLSLPSEFECVPVWPSGTSMLFITRWVTSNTICSTNLSRFGSVVRLTERLAKRSVMPSLWRQCPRHICNGSVCWKTTGRLEVRTSSWMKRTPAKVLLLPRGQHQVFDVAGVESSVLASLCLCVGCLALVGVQWLDPTLPVQSTLLGSGVSDTVLWSILKVFCTDVNTKEWNHRRAVTNDISTPERNFTSHSMCPTSSEIGSPVDGLECFYVSFRYFLAHVFQFQIFDVLCQEAGHRGPLHLCDIHGSLPAGKKLK